MDVILGQKVCQVWCFSEYKLFYFETKLIVWLPRLLINYENIRN